MDAASCKLTSTRRPRKKALLLIALGVEGLDVYCKAAEEQTLDGEQSTGDGAGRDAYQQALAILDACFAPPEDAVCVRAQFRRRVQKPDETAVQYIQELRRLADTCSFCTAATMMLQDQILQGLRDAHLVRAFIRMGDAFTVQKALEHAKQEERVERTMQQLTTRVNTGYATQAWVPRRSSSSTVSRAKTRLYRGMLPPLLHRRPSRVSCFRCGFASPRGEFSRLPGKTPYLQPLRQARTVRRDVPVVG
ncbi:hypothetical protein MTO96_023973 [Rhipicephalus appendiculatus]